MAFKKWTHSAAQLKPDTRYNSVLIAKFVNCIMAVSSPDKNNGSSPRVGRMNTPGGTPREWTALAES